MNTLFEFIDCDASTLRKNISKINGMYCEQVRVKLPPTKAPMREHDRPPPHSHPDQIAPKHQRISEVYSTLDFDPAAMPVWWHGMWAHWLEDGLGVLLIHSSLVRRFQCGLSLVRLNCCGDYLAILAILAQRPVHFPPAIQVFDIGYPLLETK